MLILRWLNEYFNEKIIYVLKQYEKHIKHIEALVYVNQFSSSKCRIAPSVLLTGTLNYTELGVQLCQGWLVIT